MFNPRVPIGVSIITITTPTCQGSALPWGSPAAPAPGFWAALGAWPGQALAQLHITLNYWALCNETWCKNKSLTSVRSFNANISLFLFWFWCCFLYFSDLLAAFLCNAWWWYLEQFCRCLLEVWKGCEDLALTLNLINLGAPERQLLVSLITSLPHILRFKILDQYFEVG